MDNGRGGGGSTSEEENDGPKRNQPVVLAVSITRDQRGLVVALNGPRCVEAKPLRVNSGNLASAAFGHCRRLYRTGCCVITRAVAIMRMHKRSRHCSTGLLRRDVRDEVLSSSRVLIVVMTCLRAGAHTSS